MSKKVTPASLANLRQHRGRSPEELKRIARRINAGSEDKDLRRLFALAAIDAFLEGYSDGTLPRSVILQLVEQGTDHLARLGARALDRLMPERRERFLDRLVTDESQRIERSDANWSAQGAASRTSSEPPQCAS